ncbi:MAG: hypothetical protein GC203_10040 [Phenylobacterium sp.]|uniref:COG4705 family protein n=1 Tax=Phenylobacterium sp. TaxID=1871053 RepID=UPI0025D5C346|nr:hypothetical protein [Phenylobacterium sp.]MBI1198190.1 hypothetical protein [Phenylobacterium sp.]
MTRPNDPAALSKVPDVTLMFWVIKCLATTLGETGGDALSMQFALGYGASSLVFLAAFGAALALQVRARRFHPALYWLVVVTTTTVGTTVSDFFDRSLGLGYVASSAILFVAVLAVLAIWARTTGRIAADHIASGPNEVFYWLTILVSNTLGTALGDFTADTAGLGFEGGAMVFAGLIATVALAWRFTAIPKPLLFWAAYVLTRPLGATLGDLLTKPVAHGGLALGQLESSLAIAGAMVAGVWLTHLAERRNARSDAA